MKSHLLIFLILVLLIAGCRPKTVYGCTDPEAVNYEPKANERDSPDPCKYFGQVVFWQKTGNTTWSVTLNDRTEVITSGFDNAPGCGTQGCATFSIVQGIYDFEIASAGMSMIRKVEVRPHNCLTERVQ